MASRSPRDTASPPPPATAQEFAAYSRDMLRSLRRIAETRQLALFSHLLDLAGAEAARIAEQGEEQP